MPMIRITPDRDRPNGWKVLELAGIPAYVEPSFFILLLVYFALGASRDRLNVSQTGIFCFAVFISLLVHEYGHALMAKVLGCSRLRIAIWSGGGLAYHSPTTRPNSMMILAAGPGLEFAFGLICMMFYFTRIYETWSIAEPVHYLFFSLVWINVFWVFFNLVPIYPLDGGQFLFHFLAQWWGDTRAMLTVARISLPLCAVIGVIGMREGFMILPIMCLNFFITNMKTVQELR